MMDRSIFLAFTLVRFYVVDSTNKILVKYSSPRERLYDKIRTINTDDKSKYK